MQLLNPAEIMTWKSNHIVLFHKDEINYPCPIPDGGLVHLSKGGHWMVVW